MKVIIEGKRTGKVLILKEVNSINMENSMIHIFYERYSKYSVFDVNNFYVIVEEE